MFLFTKSRFLIPAVSLLALTVTLFVAAGSFNGFSEQIKGFDSRLANLEKASKVNESFSGVDARQLDRMRSLEDSIAHLTNAMMLLAEDRVSQSADKRNLIEHNSLNQNVFEMQAAKESVRQQKEFLNQTFKNQPVDESWAPNAATKFDELQSNPKLQVAQITNVDCRNTICKADIAQPRMGIAEAADFENHLLMELTKEFKGGISMSREIQPDGQVKMVVYTVREGYQIPANNRQSTFIQ